MIKKLLILSILSIFCVPAVSTALEKYSKEIVQLPYPNDDYQLISSRTKEVKSKNLIYLYSVQLVNNEDDRFSANDSYQARKFICNAFGHGDPDPIADPMLSMNQDGSSVLVFDEKQKFTKAESERKFNALDMVPCQLKDEKTQALNVTVDED